jgi:putative transposase
VDKAVIDLETVRPCTSQVNYHFIWATKYRCKVLVGSVEVRLVEVLKMIAENHGYRLLVAMVHDGDYVHVFVFAKPKVCICGVVAVL